MSFAMHLISHKVRFFWCIHSVHHSPKEMKASVAFRGSFAEFLLSPHLITWLPLLGLHLLMVVIVEGFAMRFGVPFHLGHRFAPAGEAPLAQKDPYPPTACTTPAMTTTWTAATV